MFGHGYAPRAVISSDLYGYGWLFDHGACLVRAAHSPSVVCARYKPRGDPESDANSHPVCFQRQTTAKELPDPANTRR